MWVMLSHKLSSTTPCYDDGPRLEVQPVKQIAQGDSSNTFFLKLYNHLGTHVDAPNHFDVEGRKIHSYTAEELVFEKPTLADIPKNSGELIQDTDLHPFEHLLHKTDILLIRTGFQRFRDTDPMTYMRRGPCLSAEAAGYLRKFSNLRALGIDTISISSPLLREVGREAHRLLLKGRSFLIVEDMDLLGKPLDYKRVVIAPLLVEEVDSAPCTVLAEV